MSKHPEYFQFDEVVWCRCTGMGYSEDISYISCIGEVYKVRGDFNGNNQIYGFYSELEDVSFSEELGVCKGFESACKKAEKHARKKLKEITGVLKEFKLLLG